MPPRPARAPKVDQPIHHKNGALETVLRAVEPSKGSQKAPAKTKAPAKKKKPAATQKTTQTTLAVNEDASPDGADADQPPADVLTDDSDSEQQPPRFSFTPQVDEAENPFLNNSMLTASTPRQPPIQSPIHSGPRNIRFVAPLTPAQLDRLTSVAIPSSQSPRSGRHSPINASPLVTAAKRQNRKQAGKDVKMFFETRKGRRWCKLCIHKRKTTKEELSHAESFMESTASANLRKHLYSCHLDEWLAACNKMDIKITSTDNGLRDAIQDYNRRHGSKVPNPADKDRPVPIYRPFSSEAFVDAIVEWVVADDQSINVVESPFLRSIFLMLRKELKDSDIPHRTTVRTRVLEMWESHLESLENELKGAVGKISFTSDCWTDSNLSPFMAVTAHWIDAKAIKSSNGTQYSVSLRCELIGFHRVPGRHTGEHLAAAFMAIIDRLHIDHLKIGWVTLDNASNNDTLMTGLEEQLQVKGISFSSSDQRIRCFPHIVNLAVQAILTSITNMELAKDGAEDFDPTNKRDPIALLRTLINQIRASSLRRDRFASVQESLAPDKPILQLIRDVATRWSSTHIMISRALHLRQAINKFVLKNKDLHRFRLSESDWDAIAVYDKILAVPHAFQQKLSSESTPTLSEALPSFASMISVWQKQLCEFPLYAPNITSGINKLTDYYNRVMDVPAFQLAIILNPKRKLEWFQENLPAKANSIRQTLLDYLEGYTATDTNSASAQSTGSTSTTSRPTLGTPEDDENWADAILGDSNPSSRSASDSAQTLQSEVDSYLIERSPTCSTSLAFWQENQHRFPTLFKLALDILAIQGSAVPCERVFSAGKETMTARRNRIRSDLMEALQMLKFSFKSGQRLNFTAGTSRTDELSHLEQIALSTCFVPEDLTSFIDSLEKQGQNTEEDALSDDDMPVSDAD